MINEIYLKILNFVLFLVDHKNKIQIINYFKKNTSGNLTLIDVGAHKGETIKYFSKFLNLKNIYAFEPNKTIYNKLINNTNCIKKEINCFNIALGDKDEIKPLNILNESSSSTINNLNKSSKYYKKKNKIINFFSNKGEIIQKNVEIKTLSTFMDNFILNNQVILKIDTEGYEYKILKGLNKKHLDRIDFIYIEHHYDQMIIKDYNFSDINSFLKNNNFYLRFKIRMNFRKTFEYIYEKKRY